MWAAPATVKPAIATMREKNKVVLGLSGGVDSAVAALKLKASGYSITGVYLKSSLARDESAEAKAIADFCGIDLCVIDITEGLEKGICSYFVEEYCRGRTPSPCIRCNPRVKFNALFVAAEVMGAELVATGHYARIGLTASGERAIFTGVGRNDQSYMLCALGAELYPRLIFPLGEMTKEEVRAYARQQGLQAADKPDSMEICFIPDDDRIAFLEERIADTRTLKGNFVDENGKILGQHNGIHCYTVGQRKGLGIALGYPAYVSKIDPESMDIVLSPAGGEFSGTVSIADCCWHALTPDSFEADIRVRHSAGFTRGLVQKQGENAVLSFPEGIRAAAPGQYAAIYVDGGIVGCGVIV